MKKRKGTTLIEALAFLFVFSVIVVTFYSAWLLSTKHILLAKNRLVAIELAKEKMEIIRNLPFEKIAHTTGFPAGNLLQNEDIVRSGGTYRVLTQIRSVDDPYDGTLGGSPNDVNFIDYKEVKISVAWGINAQSVSLISRFVPSGIEQSASGLGVLVVNVTSEKDGGALVSGSSVRIRNTGLGFDETHATDSLGRLMLVGIPESIYGYEITVNKSGYETVSTLPPYPTTAYKPEHEHASVVGSALNTMNIYQNKKANLTIETKDFLGTEVGDVDFHLVGGRVLGVDAIDPKNISYSFDVNDATDGSGKKTFTNESPGNFSINVTESGMQVVGMSEPFSFILAPNETKKLSVKLCSETTTALLFKVKRMADATPMVGANVHIVKNDLSYDLTLVTDMNGYAFFPIDGTPFLAGTYDFVVSTDGYGNIVGQAVVSDGNLLVQEILMEVL